MRNGYLVLFKYTVFPFLICALTLFLLLQIFIHFPTYAIIGVIFLFVLGVWRHISVKKNNERRGWRIFRHGPETIFYGELREGKWEEIEIGRESRSRESHHLIYLGSSEIWKSYPGWARGRRDEIISRLKSVLREPGYKYLGGFYRFEWVKDTDFNGIKVYVGKPPVEAHYKSLGVLSMDGHGSSVEAMITNLISNLTARASNMGANAIINWTIRGGGATVKGEGEAVIFE